MGGDGMSINSLLKMRASIYRNPILDNPSVMDAYANVSPEPEWPLVKENERCMIQNVNLTSSDRQMTGLGPEDKNKYLGFFVTKYETGDRVVVTRPSVGFPTLYICSENPQVSGLTGTTNHYEYILEIERP